METAFAEILAGYGIVQPARIEPCGHAAWLVLAGDDMLVLREIKRRSAKADLSLRAIEHLLAQGFAGLPAWRRDAAGQLGVRAGHSTWLLSELVDGHGALLGLESDALATAAALGSLHRASAELNGDEMPEPLDMYHRYLSRCRDRIRSLRTYVLMAHNKLRRTAMDRGFLAAVETVLPQAEATLERLESSQWAELAEQSRKQGLFVYRRVGRNGVVLTNEPQPRAVFVDWGGCRRECHVTDVARLALRVIKGTGGDSALLGRVIAAYDRERPMSAGEKSILMLVLEFPDRLYQLAQRYYEHKRDWPENTFVRHLKRAMQEYQTQMACIQEHTEASRGG
ncbi:MAG: hypothetical protein Q8P31_07725 [Bacillota bacterium]|nr:hypothetical protein [Bacillota bacterium]